MYRAVCNLSRESRRPTTVMCSSQPYQAGRRGTVGAMIVPAEKA